MARLWSGISASSKNHGLAGSVADQSSGSPPEAIRPSLHNNRCGRCLHRGEVRLWYDLKGRTGRVCGSQPRFVIRKRGACCHVSRLASCFKLLVREAWPCFFATCQEQRERENKRCQSKSHGRTFLGLSYGSSLHEGIAA
jgi:hypothetical protein